MKKAALSLLVLVAIVAVTALAERSLVAGGADKAGPPKRTKLSCGDYRDGMERSAKSAGLKVRLAVGSWDKIPKALQIVPPGAELCGSASGAAIIVSPLFGKDLESHYAPLFAKIGCQPLTCDVTASSTSCTCKAPNGRGRVQTDTSMEVYSLHFLAL